MGVSASAPGKLVLVGEYAVLEGHEALGLAVDRRVRVDWEGGSSSASAMRFAPLQDQIIPYPMDVRQWPASTQDAVRQVEAILAHWAPEALKQRFVLSIDSQSMYDPQGHKLGLGSSAAVTVALAGLSLALAGQSNYRLEEVHHRLMALHQGGGGSGIDLGIAMVGGVIRYQAPADSPSHALWRSVSWPASIHGVIVFSGQSASTPDFIEAYRAWQQDSRSQWASTLETMGQCAKDTIAALSRGDCTAFLEGFTEYGVRMGTMGGLMGRDVVTEAHSGFCEMARTMGMAYKPCGAGGGDVGLFLSEDRDQLASLQRRLAELQVESIALSIAQAGLLVQDGSKALR